MSTNTVYGVTGHRPPSLGGYSPDVTRRLSVLADEVVATHDAEYWVTGMAQGWDLAIADAALRAGVPFVAAIAHPKQDSRWPPDQRTRFHAVLAHALRVETISQESTKGSYHARDHWIVRNSDHLVALWDGRRAGGTWATVQSAEKQNRPVINVWDKWAAGSPKPDTMWASGF